MGRYYCARYGVRWCFNVDRKEILMRCRACNSELNDWEATRKDDKGEFHDLCSDCFSEIRTAIWEREVTVSDVVPFLMIEPDEEV